MILSERTSAGSSFISLRTRKRVAYARRRGLSSRRACAVFGRRSATSRGSSSAMRRPWRSCASSRARIRGTATRRSGSFSRAGAPDACRTDRSAVAPGGPARAASAGGHASPPTARNHVWVYDATQRVMTPTTAEIRALKRRDPVLAKAMNGLPPFPDFPVGTLRGSHFHALARSIIYQQLATAAATIYGRVRNLTPGPRFPGPSMS